METHADETIPVRRSDVRLTYPGQRVYPRQSEERQRSDTPAGDFPRAGGKPPVPKQKDKRPGGARATLRAIGMRKSLLAIAVGLAVGGAAGAGILVAKPFGGESPAPVPAGTNAGAGAATAVVREGPLSSQISTNGTLTYASEKDGQPYSAINYANGVYTSLPTAGQIIKCGQTVYRVDGEAVALLCGAKPFYRTLYAGLSGYDVKQLNNQLRELGYAKSDEIDKDSNYFGGETTEAVIAMQKDLGTTQDGRLQLGEAVALPGPLRVSKTLAQGGTQARPNSVVFEASKIQRQVVVQLNAAQQVGVKVGNKVQLTLPDNSVTEGKVSRIGSVASSTAQSQNQETTANGASNAVLPIYITLTKPKAAGSLDQAPVQVRITVAGVDKALIVPVTALVGMAGNKSGVEKIDAQGRRQLIPVELGLVDNAEGVAQVSGDLAAGDRVVVPAS
ncbi:peptidoglycan-binding protein [Nonomuraea sp. B12E4]|uniref:peptidoglycan-binding protein n=1 Tax=Nonomuraea sp. B12E4 TaxID=3153564 RepID=UPI00325DE500